MNARGIAFDMLKDIYLNKTYSNLLLRKGLEDVYKRQIQNLK